MWKYYDPQNLTYFIDIAKYLSDMYVLAGVSENWFLLMKQFKVYHSKYRGVREDSELEVSSATMMGTIFLYLSPNSLGGGVLSTLNESEPV